MKRVAILAVFAAAAGCAPYTARAPEGFAPFDDARSSFAAASPEGLMYSVRHEANEPEADLRFWSEALRKRMEDAGYVVVDDGAVEASSTSGYRLQLAAPLGREDYTYLIALFVHGSSLVIVEAAGEVSRFEPKKDAILAAIGNIQLR